MSQTTIIIIAVIVVIALLLLFLLRSRKQHVSFDATAPLPKREAPRPVAKPGAAAPIPAPQTPASPVPAPPISAAPVAVPEEGHDVGDEAAAAIEDVIDQFIGIDAHPSGAQARGAGDQLTLLKGLGPKAETKLHEIGVTTFAQIAAWNAADVAAIDAQLGAFKGRIVRDQWVEQAKLLAAGDTAGFEAKFGKLGG